MFICLKEKRKKCILDEEKANSVFLKQLGDPFENIENLSLHRKALLAAYLCYARGDRKYKEEAIELLDTISASFTWNKDIDTPPSITFPESTINQLINDHKEILEESSIKLFSKNELTFFMALLTRARQKGILASSQFLWLRPLDRTLWYTLNQCGSQTAWAESYAPWVQYNAIKFAQNADIEAQIVPAVMGLKEHLTKEGWLPEEKEPEKKEINIIDTPPKSNAEPEPLLGSLTDDEIMSITSSTLISGVEEEAKNTFYINLNLPEFKEEEGLTEGFE